MTRFTNQTKIQHQLHPLHKLTIQKHTPRLNTHTTFNNPRYITNISTNTETTREQDIITKLTKVHTTIVTTHSVKR